MTVGSRLWVEAVYLNAVQVASRAGFPFFVTNEWVTLAPKLLTDSLVLAEGLDEGMTLGGAFPSTFPSPTTLTCGVTPVVAPVAAPIAASLVVPVEELASPDFPPISPAFSEGPPPTPTPVPMPALTISREPSSNSGVVESIRTEPEIRGRGKTRPVAPLPKRSTRKRVASEISRSPDVAVSAPPGDSKGKGPAQGKGHAVSLWLYVRHFPGG